jgi:hypothetical protein
MDIVSNRRPAFSPERQSGGNSKTAFSVGKWANLPRLPQQPMKKHIDSNPL